MHYKNNVPFLARGLALGRTWFSGGRTGATLLGHGGLGEILYYGTQEQGLLVPAFGVSVSTGMHMFDKALAALAPERPVGLLYHGMPSVHHPPCGIEPEDFAAQMETLYREGIRCITMKQYAREYLGCSC